MEQLPHSKMEKRTTKLHWCIASNVEETARVITRNECAFLGHDGWCWYSDYKFEWDMVIVVNSEVSYEKLIDIMHCRVKPKKQDTISFNNIYFVCSKPPQDMYSNKEQHDYINSIVKVTVYQ